MQAQLFEDLGRGFAAFGVVDPGKVPPALIGVELGKEFPARGEPLQVEQFWLHPAMHRFDVGMGVGGSRRQETVLADVALHAEMEAPVAFGFVLAAVLAAVVRDRKSTRLNSSHIQKSRMPSSA